MPRSPATALSVILRFTVPVYDSEAVAGYKAGIPCDLSPPIPGDSVLLVIWYKDDIKPIYSYDARNPTGPRPQHWSNGGELGGRAQFRADMDPAKLTLDPVKPADVGLYRCRVDFRVSPTRNVKINLTVILPPEKVTLVNDKGEPIEDKFLGPFTEGTSVNITCVSSGGRPLPRVSWWRGREMVDDKDEVLSEKRVRNTLHLDNLGRQSLHQTYSCQASNNHLVLPQTANFTIKMILKPLWVKILGENRAFSAEQRYEVTCEAVGARPAPKVTWWKGSNQLRNARQSVRTTKDENVTISSLSFTPHMTDSGKFLTCRVGNTPHIVEDGWRLNIHHVPVVTLELGNSQNLSAIVEGMDVIFECNIKSNPWVYKVAWRHKGEALYNSAAQGMFLINNQSLFLQAVTRERSGLYTCVASNQEGDGESNPIQLDVKYAPACQRAHVETLGVARYEPTRLHCDVDANPDHVTFTWRLNGSTALAAGLVTSQRSRSVATYTPTRLEDYGTLLCVGSNGVGLMTAPCAFLITPSGPPDMPSNCSVTNQTADSLQVDCELGWDGGLEQWFELALHGALRGPLLRNISSGVPQFHVDGLREGEDFDIRVRAVNARGHSESTWLTAYAVKTAERQMSTTAGTQGITPVLVTLTPLVGVILGVAVTLVTVTLALLVALRQRQRKHQQAKKYSDESSKQDNSSQDSLDKNPDIIPHNSDYQCAEKPIVEKNTSLYTVPLKQPLSTTMEETETTDVSSTHTKLLTEFTNVSDCAVQTSMDTTFRDYKSIPFQCPVVTHCPAAERTLVTSSTRF